LFCGSQGWARNDIISDRVQAVPPGALVIHGGARGADRIAGRLASDRGDLYVLPIRPLWPGLGKRAGLERNSVMLSLLDPAVDWVEAFYWADEPWSTPGTADTVRKAHDQGIPLHVTWRNWTSRSWGRVDNSR